MFNFDINNHIFILASACGFITAVTQSLIDKWFESFVLKRSEMTAKEIIQMSLLSGLLVGWLLSIIFYAFAITDTQPIKTILLPTVTIGFVAPLIVNLFSLFRLKANF